VITLFTRVGAALAAVGQRPDWCDIGYYINHGAKKTPAKEIVLPLVVSRCHEKFMGQKADDIYR
jgi:hypothetical protein